MKFYFLYLFLLSMLLVIMVNFLFMVIFMRKLLEFELMSSYECGFDLIKSARLSFSYRFFLISILFVIFDVEISLILPIPFLLSKVAGMLLFIMFIMILVLGLFYEYNYGSLDWMSVYTIS